MFSTSTPLHSDKWFRSDTQFHHLYPVPMQLLACRHWTPLSIARKAAQFLVPEPEIKVLDIGSGVGKFCLAAAYYKPNAFFTGIEQRNNLIAHAETARKKLNLENVNFLNGNFTRINFKEYDHFYFYNSFYENLAGKDKIDDTIDYTNELYYYYCRNMFKKLDQMPAGTRMVTFHSLGSEIPSSYHLMQVQADNLLKFWIKK